MSTRANKLHVPAMPFGYLPRYFLDRSFSLAGLGCSFNYTPRLAINPQIYLDKGCSTININSGYAGGPSEHQGEYAAINRANRSVFLGPEYIQDSGGGKHFQEFSLADCRAAANYAYNRANGYGVITSGAQEGRFDNDYWAQLSYGATGSLSAYKNLSQAWGEVMQAHPGCMYHGCYDGIVYLDMGDSKTNFRNALSSNQNAFNYLVAHNYQPNPYFSEGLYNFHPPLLNLYYRSSTDPLTKYAEVRLAIKLTQMALAHVGKSWPVMVFVFPGKTEFVNHVGQGYSEQLFRDTPGGGTFFDYNFPGYSPQFQFDQTFTALDQTRTYYGWEDTLIYGTNPAWVPPDITRGDNFIIRQHQGGSVTVKSMGPTPWQSGIDYPFSPSFEGPNDMQPLAAEFYEEVARYGGQNSQLLRSRRASGNTAWTTINSGSLVDFWENREAVVDGARNGNYGWVKISDYGPAVAAYDREVDVGSGQTVLCEVDPSAINIFKYNLN